MSETAVKQIRSYLNSGSRNKIIIHTRDIPSIKAINLGKVFSEELLNVSSNKHYSLKASQILEEILINSKYTHKEYGTVLALHNLGILFEPSLKIDILTLLGRFSVNSPLFLRWEGEVYETKLYFLSKKNGIEINIEHLSHLTI